MVKAKILDQEKENILKTIREKDETIINLNKELILLKRRIESAEMTQTKDLPEMSPIIYDLLRNLISNYIGPDSTNEIPKEILNRRINRFFEELNGASLHELKINGIIDNNRNLTEKGFKFIDSISRRYFR